jgi:hypothetical protein
VVVGREAVVELGDRHGPSLARLLPSPWSL